MPPSPATLHRPSWPYSEAMAAGLTDSVVSLTDLHFALRVLIRNERHGLHAYHPHLLQRHSLWHPDALHKLAGQINERSWQPHPASAGMRLKGRFATRPLISLHGPEELMVYAHLAARLRDAVSPKRRAWYGHYLFGNVPTGAGEVALIDPYLPHMLALNDHLSRRVRRRPVILSLDISGFYEHVQHRVLLDIVRRERLLGPLDTWLLEETLASFASRFGPGTNLPQGLPQSYPALSAILAEAYLIPPTSTTPR